VCLVPCLPGSNIYRWNHSERRHGSRLNDGPKNKQIDWYGTSPGARMSAIRLNIVAKVPKRAAASFPPGNQATDHRQSRLLQTRYENRPRVQRTTSESSHDYSIFAPGGSVNLSPMPQKDFAHYLPREQTQIRKRQMSEKAQQFRLAKWCVRCLRSNVPHRVSLSHGRLRWE
jgi:hypothetical protein